MKKPYKILVAEDDPITQKLISIYLKNYNPAVIVSNGEDAINECMTNSFDLILLDIKLQNSIDGVQTLKKIKKISSCINIPVLAITAFAMKGDREYFLGEGFNGYLAKPFAKDKFIKFIENSLPKIFPYLFLLTLSLHLVR